MRKYMNFGDMLVAERKWTELGEDVVFETDNMLSIPISQPTFYSYTITDNKETAEYNFDNEVNIIDGLVTGEV